MVHKLQHKRDTMVDMVQKNRRDTMVDMVQRKWKTDTMVDRVRHKRDTMVDTRPIPMPSQPPDPTSTVKWRSSSKLIFAICAIIR